MKLRLMRGVVVVLAVAVTTGVPGAILPAAASPIERPTGQAKTDPSLLTMAASHPRSTLPMIVRKTDPLSGAPERLFRSLGGTISRELPLIKSFSGRLPARALSELSSSPAVWHVWGDGHLRARSTDMAQYDSNSPNTAWKATIAPNGSASLQGSGVTVALLDTGVRPVRDLGNRILARVDFTPDRDGWDRYGHGTHMAGIIAGDGSSSGGRWVGTAPKANLVSVKVAGRDGSTDVSVVIAGMQWIVTHRGQYNIRVMNLSYGTDAKQSYSVDPLDYAVEQVWLSGIFVAASAGNRGPNTGTVSKPGDDPFVVTVGAGDTKNTPSPEDDQVAPFSSRGPTQDAVAKPDLVAPSISIVSNRAVGSTIDLLHPTARVGDSYFKGTGTSQATAIVSGVAAALFSASPALTPDLAKAILIRTADNRIAMNSDGAGAGMVNATAAMNLVSSGYSSVQPANLGLVPSSGLGSLELSRGTLHVRADVNNDGERDAVRGEIGVLGRPWVSVRWVGVLWRARSWVGNSWDGRVWVGNTWDGNTWDGNTWDGNTWDGNTWDVRSWSGMLWLGNTWDANTWDANTWAGDSWN